MEYNFRKTDMSYEQAKLSLEYSCKSEIRDNDEKLRHIKSDIEAEHQRRLRNIEEKHMNDLNSLESEFRNRERYQNDAEYKTIKKRINKRRQYETKRAKDEHSYNIKEAELGHAEHKKRIKERCEKEKKELRKTYNITNPRKRLGKILLFALILLGAFLVIISNKWTKEAELNIKILNTIETTFRVKQETPHYTSNRIPSKEYVKYSVGDYYKINLKLADSKERVLFPIGEYYIEKDKDELLNSLSNFKSEVYNVIEKNLTSQIYIKGTADSLGNLGFKEPFKTPYNADNGYDNIEYFPRDEIDDVYLNQTKIYSVGDSVENKDLPILRARFMQKLLIESDDEFSEPIILEGNVAKVVDEKERNAYLILFVDWDSYEETEYFKQIFIFGVALSLISLVVLLYLILKK